MSAHGVDRTGAASGSGAALNPIDQTMIDAKGDLIAGTAADAAARLAVGANDTILVADSTQTTGLKWAAGSVAFQAIAGGATVETAPDTADIVMLSDVSLTPDNGRAMTLGDLFKVIATFTADLAPDRTADYLLSYDASAAGIKKVIMQQFPLPRAYLAGLGLTNNVADATNDIDFAVGEARDSTHVANLVAATAMTKQLDVAWAAGSAAGGRMSAAAIANTTYHCYVIRKDTDGTCDFGFDTSATAPTLPSGYTYFRRIGSILREGGVIVPFVQNGDYFQRSTLAADVSLIPATTSAVTRTLSAPLGVRLRVVLHAGLASSTTVANYWGLLSDLSVPDVAATTANANLATNVAGGGSTQSNHSQVEIWTNTSAQIRSRLSSNDANFSLYVNTRGWIDTRGKD